MTIKHMKLGDLIKPAKVERAGGRDLPVLSMTMHEGLIDHAQKFKKRVASADTSAYKVIKFNQLVVGFPIDEGVLSFQKLYPEAIVSPAYAVWEFKEESPSITSTFLEAFLKSPQSLKFYVAKLRGTTARRRSLPDDIFLELQVPIPTRERQLVFEKLQEIRVMHESAITNLAELKNNLLHELL